MCAKYSFLMHIVLKHGVSILERASQYRTSMISPPWSPFLLTEHTVSSQSDLVHIVLDLDDIRRHSKRCVPLLLDMDIHYRLLKMLYGVGLKEYRMKEKLQTFPFCYGIYPGIFYLNFPCVFYSMCRKKFVSWFINIF